MSRFTPQRMVRTTSGSARLVRAAATVLLCGLVCTSLWAAQRVLRSKVRNYPHTPVTLQEAKIITVELFATPSQPLTPGLAPGTKIRGSRVRYANRTGLLPSTTVLEGDVLCRNQSRQTVEVLGLTIVMLDAFHQPLQPPGQAEPYFVQQMPISIPSGASQRITLEQQPLGSTDIYEVAVVVTRVRFTDGSVWLAPAEELTDIF